MLSNVVWYPELQQTAEDQETGEWTQRLQHHCPATGPPWVPGGLPPVALTAGTSSLMTGV